MTPPLTHGNNTLDRAEPSTHNSAEKKHGPLSNPKKRGRKAFDDEESTPRRREFSVLRDEILDNPSKKRRVSSHLVRESVGNKYNANMGSARRRSNSSISKSSNGTPQRRLSPHRAGLPKTPTQVAVNASALVSPNYAGCVNTSEPQSNESLELFTASEMSNIQNSMHSTYPGTSSNSQNSSQPLRRSTRLSALRQELHDLTPSKSTEYQHPEGTTNSIFAATSPEAVADNSVGTSTYVSANKGQYIPEDLSKEHSHTQSGRVSKSTATKKSKGLASSQLPRRRSDRLGRGRL